METIGLILIIGFLGGIVAIDSAPAFQFMVNRPIFMCSVLGALLGEAGLGITFGALFELPYLVNLPLGGKHDAENGLGAIVAAGLGILFYKEHLNQSNIIIIINFLYGMFIARMATLAVDAVRDRNLELVREAETAINRGEFSKISKVTFVSVGYSFLMGFLVTVSATLVGIVLLPVIIRFLHPDFDIAFGIAKYGILGVGVGSALSLLLSSRQGERYFLIVFLLGVVIYLIAGV